MATPCSKFEGPGAIPQLFLLLCQFKQKQTSLGGVWSDKETFLAWVESGLGMYCFYCIFYSNKDKSSQGEPKETQKPQNIHQLTQGIPRKTIKNQ